MTSYPNQKAKTLIFRCRLPPFSDTQLSMKDSGSLQLKRVTVSGYHLRLNFMPIDDVLVNISKIRKNENTKNILFLNSRFKTSTRSNTWFMNLVKQKAEIDKYIVFYDRKCRFCLYSVRNSTINNQGFLNPRLPHSIKCITRVSKIFNFKAIFKLKRSHFIIKLSKLSHLS
jgi:hypothetical protein